MLQCLQLHDSKSVLPTVSLDRSVSLDRQPSLVNALWIFNVVWEVASTRVSMNVLILDLNDYIHSMTKLYYLSSLVFFVIFPSCVIKTVANFVRRHPCIHNWYTLCCNTCHSIDLSKVNLYEFIWFCVSAPRWAIVQTTMWSIICNIIMSPERRWRQLWVWYLWIF